MKKLIHLFLILCMPVHAQLLIDFENDSLQQWIQIPQDRWTINDQAPLSGSYSLHHSFDNPDAGVDIIALDLQTPCLDDTLSVQFSIRHAYAPSSGNNWQLFLLGELDTLSPVVPGRAIYFGVNFTGSDDLLKLWYYNGKEKIPLIESPINYQEEIGTDAAPLFFIKRYPTGEWKISWSLDGSLPATQLGSGMEPEECNGNYLGLRYSYSSAQDRKLWLDDLSVHGHFFRDTLPPQLQTTKVDGLNTLILEFDEHPVLSPGFSVFLENNSLDSLWIDETRIFLSFNYPFPNRKEVELVLRNLSDDRGNLLSLFRIAFQQDLVVFGEMVINELLPDPSPAVYMPEFEYVELYNQSGKVQSLSGWKLQVNNSFYSLPAVSINADSYLVLCSNNDPRGEGLDHFSACFGSSVLPNAGASIKLLDPFGRIIHLVEYGDLHGYDQEKGEGGWSLEQVDPLNYCGDNDNWIFSEDASGGSPGFKNSVFRENPDLGKPTLFYLGSDDSATIYLHFNEALMAAEFAISNTVLNSSLLTEKPSRHISMATSDLLNPGYSYELKLSDITDCAGNKADETKLVFSLPEKVKWGSLLINEIMYDPLPGAPEYIELYNPGHFDLDISEVKIELSVSGKEAVMPRLLLDGSRHLSAGSYLVICKNKGSFLDFYSELDESQCAEVEQWIALPADEACIKLTDRSGILLDEICYSPSMQNDFLADPAGIALERICDPMQNNWNSCLLPASSSSGYGTPGKENSTTFMDANQDYKFSVTPTVISPDQDAYQDIMYISFKGDKEIESFDLFITDIQGNLLRQLVQEGLPGAENTFYWDGRDEDMHRVSPGIYILHCHLYGSRRRVFRKAVAVSYK